MSIPRYSVYAAVLVAIMAVPHCDAQVVYGSLTGNVTDPASAVVPSVHVKATNQETNVKSETKTDDRGIYRFTNLQPGLYKVTVTAPSFRAYSETGVPVQPNEIQRVRVQLQISHTTDSIEVSAGAVALQTDKANIHSEISAP